MYLIRTFLISGLKKNHISKMLEKSMLVYRRTEVARALGLQSSQRLDIHML